MRFDVDNFPSLPDERQEEIYQMLEANGIPRHWVESVTFEGDQATVVRYLTRVEYDKASDEEKLKPYWNPEGSKTAKETVVIPKTAKETVVIPNTLDWTKENA